MKIDSIIIFCGGEGTRIQNLTKYCPKILIKILNKPFIDHLLKILKKNKIKKIYLLSKYRSRQIENYVKYEYVKQPWFEKMTPELFKIMERDLGWHLMITAKL